MATGALLGLLAAATVCAQSPTITPVYGSSKAGAVSQVSIVALQPGWLVTAVKNSSGNLQLIVWHDTGTAIIRKGSYKAEAITYGPVVAALNSNLVVTAAFNSAFQLELDSWNVSSTGAITHLSRFDAGMFGNSVAITASAACGCAVTATNGSSNLDESVWWVSPAGLITVGPSISTGSGNIDQVAIASESPGAGELDLMNAVSAGGTLDVTPAVFEFEALLTGGVCTGYLSHDCFGFPPSGIAGAGAIGQLAVAYWYSTPTVLAADLIYTTAVVNGSGNLELISWDDDLSLENTARLASGTAGAASQVALTTLGPAPAGPGGPLPVTAVVNGKGNLSVEVWYSTGPKTLKELATYNTKSPITQVAVASEGDSAHVVTAAESSKGDLEIQVWLYTAPIVP